MYIIEEPTARRLEEAEKALAKMQKIRDNAASNEIVESLKRLNAQTKTCDLEK